MSERFDRFYLALENRFRGSSDHIRAGQSIFVPVFKRCHAAAQSQSAGDNRRVLDIGCGRGEWLDLLRDQGIACQGLDMNADMVALCEQRGHQASRGNALDTLRALPDASLLGVTAFHVIEHIDPQSALDWLAEIHRCLVPGGIVLFETPNPENVRTATHNFFIDPTHIRPIPPILLQFMFEFSGFSGNEIVRMRPLRNKGWRWRLASPASRFMIRHFLKEQDYAVIGVKGPVPPGLLPAI
jgi:SAM-dependent methyltransferase